MEARKEGRRKERRKGERVVGNTLHHLKCKQKKSKVKFRLLHLYVGVKLNFLS